MKYSVVESSFKDELELLNNSEGLVFYGFGVEPDVAIEKNVKSLTAFKILNDFNQLFQERVIKITTTGGRCDLVLLFTENNGLDIGRLAMWRLETRVSSWISDYIVNYANQHGRFKPTEFSETE